MPWQVKALGVVGAPVAIACYLVWVMATHTAASNERIELMLHEHVETAGQLGETLKVLEQDHRASNSRIEDYMRLMCVQGAKSDIDRRQCLSVR